ncbi:MAG: sugar MFS transporter [Bacteroidetes bacterium]|nr:sugar MFS transporter [Bacteroidota bacterium]MCL5268445.1 sugar MFS transporter [Bacteroidota bacterium]
MKRNYYVVILIFLTFFVISFITNILGALNPDVIQSFNLSLTLAGLLPFAFFIAYGVMSIPAGMLVEKYKEKTTMVLAFVVAFAGALLFSMFPHYLVFLLSLFLMGTGMAMLQVAINPLLRVAGGEEHFAFNSVLAQLIFGGASFIAPMFLTYLITSLDPKAGANTVKLVFSGLVPETLSWTSLYWVFALITVLMVVVILVSRFPAVERKEDEKAGTWETHKNLFKQKTVILFFIGIFAYVGTEQGVSYWISKFLYTYHNYDPLTVGASTVGWFWGMMSVGCLIGLVFLKLFDSRKILSVAVLFAATFLSVALFGPGHIALYAFPMVGFSLSVMWSIVFSLALNSVDKHHGSFAGILCTAIIGGAVIQLIIGKLGDMFGLRIGMLFIYLTLGYLFSIGIWAKPIINNETISSKKKLKKAEAVPAAD